MPNVVVKFHNLALPSFAAWRSRLATELPGDPGMYDLLRQAMKDWLVKTTGHPLGCAWYPAMNPPRYAAKFTANVWVHFIRREKDRGKTLDVVVIGVSDSPPAG